MKEDQCGNCFYWRMDPDRRAAPDDKIRFCKRRPPSTMMAPDGRIASLFPQIQHDDWCGDYKAATSIVH